MHGAKTAGTLTISGLKTPGAAMEASYTSGREKRRSFWSQMTAACILCRRRGGNAARALIQNGAEEGEKRHERARPCDLIGQ